VLIKIPRSFPEERTYIVSVLLDDFLGLNIEIAIEDRLDTSLQLEGRELTIADDLFAFPEHDWLAPASLPARPLARWDPAADGLGLDLGWTDIPILYGRSPHRPVFLSLTERKIDLGLDVFGSSFFMLSRYEEAVKPDRDNHDRFPHTASLAIQEHFLERAIVNEYLEVLWACMKRLWPGLERKKREYKVILSHDVDRPLSITGAKATQILRTLMGDVAKRRDIDLTIRRIRAIFSILSRNYDQDPAASFDFIMDISEQHSLASAFNFITGHSGGDIDGNYSVNMPWMQSLIRRLYNRGHEIGFHPSYNTYRDAAETKREFEHLRRAAECAGVSQAQWGGRQHYLRWHSGDTWRNWARAGLDYDSTLGFAGCPGFRAGTCFEYPVFDLVERRSSGLIERPLIVMDTTLMYPEYMQISYEDIIRTCRQFSSTCRKFGGSFSLLWHNDNLVSAAQKRLYRDAVSVSVNC